MDLKKIPLFAEISEENIDKIVTISHTVEMVGNENVFSEGDAGEALYIILEGTVSAIKEIDKEKGLEKTISSITTGNFFGEMALLDGRSRSATIRAVSNVKLLRIKRDDFNKLLIDNTEVASHLLFAIISEVSNRLRESNTELVTLYDTGKLMASSQNLDELCMNILDRILHTVEGKCGLILIKNEITNELEIKAQIGFLKPVNVNIGKSIIDIIFKTGKNLHVNDFQNEPVNKEVELCGCEDISVIGIPLKKIKEIKGVVIINSNIKDAFTARKFIMVKAVATQLATAIENTMLYQEKADREKLNRQYVSF